MVKILKKFSKFHPKKLLSNQEKRKKCVFFEIIRTNLQFTKSLSNRLEINFKQHHRGIKRRNCHAHSSYKTVSDNLLFMLFYFSPITIILILPDSFFNKYTPSFNSLFQSLLSPDSKLTLFTLTPNSV